MLRVCDGCKSQLALLLLKNKAIVALRQIHSTHTYAACEAKAAEMREAGCVATMANWGDLNAELLAKLTSTSAPHRESSPEGVAA